MRSEVAELVPYVSAEATPKFQQGQKVGPEALMGAELLALWPHWLSPVHWKPQRS